MGANSKIEWTHHTMNPWIGCQKVSPACTNCYAEVSTPVRVSGKIGLKLWGGESTGAVRRVASEDMWKQPVTWNKQAAKEGVRKRVFCASLADVFEKFDGPVVNANGEKLFYQPGVYHPHWNTEAQSDLRNPALSQLSLADVRYRLFYLITQTPWLDWLLLTKRPENAYEMMQRSGLYAGPKVSQPQQNLWIGTTVENQASADERIPHLLKVPAVVRFLSCEPLLGPVEFSAVNRRSDAVKVLGQPALSGIHWVIAGGESGRQARPMQIEWAISLRDQCQAAGVAFHFKQWGQWCPFTQIPDESLNDVELDRREMLSIGEYSYHKLGKKLSGRQLDGQEWNEVPTCRAK